MGQSNSLPEGVAVNRKYTGDAANAADIGSNLKRDDSITAQPNRRLLIELSTPSEWISSFQTSTDDELISLLEEGSILKNYLGSNVCDLTPLCTELRTTALRIKEYRRFETILGSKTEMNSGTIHPRINGHSSAMPFYVFHPSPKSNGSIAEEDGLLIDLCERIIAVSSSRAKKYKLVRNRQSKNNQSNKKPILALSQVRQKLVPSKLKEHVFWESLWVLLYERKKLRNQQEFFETIEKSTKDVTVEKKSTQTSENTKQVGPANNEERIALLEEQLKDAVGCISGLKLLYQSETREREELEKLIVKMWEMMPRKYEETKERQQVCDHTRNSNTAPCIKLGGSSAANDSTMDEEDGDQSQIDVATTAAAAGNRLPRVSENVPCKHTGKWIMSKDSIEFLSFPSEAKEALRTEKQKRLKRVMEEMEFILDSDEPKDSKGEWSCCKKTDYNATCALVVGE